MDRMTDEAMRDEQQTMEQLLHETQERLVKAVQGRRSTLIAMCAWMAAAGIACVAAAVSMGMALDLMAANDRLRAGSGWELRQCQNEAALRAVDGEMLRAHVFALEHQLSDAEVVQRRCSEFVDYVEATFLGHGR